MTGFTPCIVAAWRHFPKKGYWSWSTVIEPWHVARKTHADMIARGTYAIVQTVDKGFIPKPNRYQLQAFAMRHMGGMR